MKAALTSNPMHRSGRQVALYLHKALLSMLDPRGGNFPYVLAAFARSVSAMVR